MATGPSLSLQNIKTLYEKKEICIGVNGIIKLYEHLNWRPDYYVYSDPLVLEYARKYLLQNNENIVFAPDVAPIHNCGSNYYDFNHLFFRCSFREKWKCCPGSSFWGTGWRYGGRTDS